MHRYRFHTFSNPDIVSSKESFGITEGVKSVSMHAGSTLAITNPEKATIYFSLAIVLVYTQYLLLSLD
jgi:hypothetical protein